MSRNRAVTTLGAAVGGKGAPKPSFAAYTRCSISTSVLACIAWLANAGPFWIVADESNFTGPAEDVSDYTELPSRACPALTVSIKDVKDKKLSSLARCTSNVGYADIVLSPWAIKACCATWS